MAGAWFSAPGVDWLDVTYSPAAAPFPDIERLLLDFGAAPDSAPDRYRLGSGVAHLHSRSTYARASLTGGILDSLRMQGAYDSLLMLLADEPHRVTRLDVALDIDQPGSKVVPVLYRDHLSSGFRLRSRKSLTARAILQPGPDGLETGTVYAGHRRSRADVTARIYDKGQEQFDKGLAPFQPWVRYELTFRGALATLKDAHSPAPIFWHHASPELLSAPEGVSPWVPGESPGWVHERRARDPVRSLKRSLDQHAALLKVWGDLASEIGPSGRAYLLGLIERGLGSSVTQ